MTSFEARNAAGQVVRTFSHQDMADAYADSMSTLGMVVRIVAVRSVATAQPKLRRVA